MKIYRNYKEQLYQILIIYFLRDFSMVYFYHLSAFIHFISSQKHSNSFVVFFIDNRNNKHRFKCFYMKIA